MRSKSLAAAILIACAAAAPAGAQTILKLAHTDQQQSSRHAGSLLFAKKVKELTQGRYQVRVYCCGQLGNDPKLVEQVALGGIDFAVTSTGSYAPHLPTLNLTMAPFVFDSYEQGWKFYDESKWLQDQFAKAPAKGFRFLAAWESGFRQMTTKQPLATPEDARGRKMRGWANEMVLWSLEAMGFGVQIIPVPEVYVALQQGAVSGQENPIDVSYTQKFHEVAPYVTLTNHIYSPTPIAVSERTWQKLPEADRKLIAQAAAEVTPYMRKLIRENEDRLLADMQAHGATVNRSPDIAAFRKAVEPVYAKAREKYGADAETVFAEMAAVRAGGQ